MQHKCNPLLLSCRPQVFIKSELKVGVIYVKENQFSEEHILDNNENSPLFDEFLQTLGDKVRLRGFDKYKGGLDTVHDLTGIVALSTDPTRVRHTTHTHRETCRRVKGSTYTRTYDV